MLEVNDEKEYDGKEKGCPTWEEAEAFFKEVSSRRIKLLNTSVRTKTLGTTEIRGSPAPFPKGTVIAQRFTVLKHCKNAEPRLSNSFVHLCSRNDEKMVAVKIGRVDLKSADHTFDSVYREFLVWCELEQWFPVRYLNPPHVEPKLDPRGLSFPALGFSMQDLMDKFTVLPIGLCLIAALDSLCALKQLHDIGFVHRQVRPRHLCVGLKAGDTATNSVYLIDLSQATRYVHFPPDPQIPFIPHKPDPFYDSTDVLKGKPYTRRDDLLSWIYTILAMRGCAFWRKFKGDQLTKIKDESGADRLAVGFARPIGSVMATVLQYLRTLQPHARPDYAFLMQSIVSALSSFCRNGIPGALPEKEMHVFKMQKFETKTPQEEVMALRYKIMFTPQCFTYLDEVHERVREKSVTPCLSKWFTLMSTKNHDQMYQRIDERMKIPKKWPDILEETTVPKQAENTVEPEVDKKKENEKNEKEKNEKEKNDQEKEKIENKDKNEKVKVKEKNEKKRKNPGRIPKKNRRKSAGQRATAKHVGR
ncbi:Protein kinase domain-containing protein [Aphelenchoides besseyi]|nr:Protein kinase domain-containing protein [Aphelenchoides besseyi]